MNTELSIFFFITPFSFSQIQDLSKLAEENLFRAETFTIRIIKCLVDLSG
jgi:hypothetical protein